MNAKLSLTNTRTVSYKKYFFRVCQAEKAPSNRIVVAIVAGNKKQGISAFTKSFGSRDAFLRLATAFCLVQRSEDPPYRWSAGGCYRPSRALVRHECHHRRSVLSKAITSGSRFSLLLAGERPYRCPFAGCDKAFAQLSNLQQHQKNHEGKRAADDARPFLCRVCDRRFTTDNGLAKHIAKVGTVLSLLLACVVRAARYAAILRRASSGRF